RLRTERVEVHTHNAANGIDGADTGRTILQRSAARVFDVRHVRGHFRPNGFLRGTHDPAHDFAKDFRILAHSRAHLALGQTMWAGKIQFECIHSRVLAFFDDLNPRVFLVFLHDGRDEHAVGELVFAFLEFIYPQLERAVADEFDIFPADDFARGRME